MVRQLLGELLDKEASRKVASRKVVINGEEITAEQALIRSMYLNGIRGKVTPQLGAIIARLVPRGERSCRAGHAGRLAQNGGGG